MASLQQTLFHPAEVELSETVEVFLAAVERLNPARVVFDSVTELRLLAGDSLRYRRQLLGLRQFFAARRCTTLLLEDTAGGGDALGGLLDGLLELEQTAPEYGNVRRRLRLIKLRGTPYHGGYHNFEIRTGGLEVFPRLVAPDEGGQHRVGERDERRGRTRRAPRRRSGGGHRLPPDGADRHRQDLGGDALRLRRRPAGAARLGLLVRRAPRDLLSA